MALIRTIQTGNLPQSFVSKVVKYDVKADFLKDNKPADGFRFATVGFKVSKADKAKSATEDVTVPQSFAFPVPILALDATSPKHISFLTALALDYQDSMISAVVGKKSVVSFDNLDSLIADYFDTSRNSLLPSKEDMETWCNEYFVPAYLARLQQRNDVAKNDASMKVLSDAEMARLIEIYSKRIVTIVGRNCSLPFLSIKDTRQLVERLVETGNLENNEETQYFVEKCNQRTANPEDEIVDSGV